EPMTEVEWLSCGNPRTMLAYLDGLDILSDGKLRLFHCACVRRIWHLLRNECGRRVVEVAERYADDVVSLEELRQAYADFTSTIDERASISFFSAPDSLYVLCAAAATAWEHESGVNLEEVATVIAFDGLTQVDYSQQPGIDRRVAAEEQTQAGL